MGECSKNTGVVLKFEQAAMRGLSMPKNLNGIEMAQFWGLTYLYKLYYAGHLSREDGILAKRAMMGVFHTAQRRIDADRRLNEHTVNLWKTIDLTHGRFVREYTIEAAQALSDAIYGKLRVIPEVVKNGGNGFTNCPVCNRLFEPAHAARKPKYCEGCGFALRWEE